MKNRTHKQEVGNIGEHIAVEFLRARGHSILGRNIRRPWGELDIISRENNTVHFVEVKTISREKAYSVSHATLREYQPEDNMHEKKIERLHRIIATYIEAEHIQEDWQLDLVAAELFIKDKKALCRLVENVL